MKDSPGWGLDDESRPQRLVAVGEAARRPMLHRHERHRGCACERHPVTPVMRFGGNGLVMITDDGVVA